MVDIDVNHLHNKIKELLIDQCGKDKVMKNYLLQGGFDSDIDEFAHNFAHAASDHDEEGDDDEGEQDDDEDLETVYPDKKE